MIEDVQPPTLWGSQGRTYPTDREKGGKNSRRFIAGPPETERDLPSEKLLRGGLGGERPLGKRSKTWPLARYIFIEGGPRPKVNQISLRPTSLI